MRRWLILAGLLALVPAPVVADDVFLKGGGRVTGRILSRTATSLEMDIGAGRVTLSMNSVERIEEGRSALHDYQDRAAAIRATDADGWLQLARWASNAGLGTQARQAYERVLDADPDQPEANRALGRVALDGRWMSEEDSYRARGYVLFEGAWITPAEQDAMLRERAAVAQAERARLEAEQRALEAEARAREAEARAQAAYYPMIVTPTIPAWFDIWGRGPGIGPHGPPGRHPRLRARPPASGPARPRGSTRPSSKGGAPPRSSPKAGRK